jgi:hypothetical protein
LDLAFRSERTRLIRLIIVDTSSKGCGLLLNPGGIGLGRYRLVASDI